MSLLDEANGFIGGDIFYSLHVRLTNFYCIQYFFNEIAIAP